MVIYCCGIFQVALLFPPRRLLSASAPLIFSESDLGIVVSWVSSTAKVTPSKTALNSVLFLILQLAVLPASPQCWEELMSPFVFLFFKFILSLTIYFWCLIQKKNVVLKNVLNTFNMFINVWVELLACVFFCVCFF